MRRGGGGRGRDVEGQKGHARSSRSRRPPENWNDRPGGWSACNAVTVIYRRGFMWSKLCFFSAELLRKEKKNSYR